MPLWNLTNKRPTFQKNQSQEKTYVTPYGWVVKRNGNQGKKGEEVIVAIGNLDTLFNSGTPVLEAVFFANNAQTLTPKLVPANTYIQGANINVVLSYTHTVSVLQLGPYTNISGGPFVNGESISQTVNSSFTATGTIQMANSTVVTIYSGGASAVGAGVGGFVATSNSTTKITGGTSGATANLTSITGPTMNVQQSGALTTNVTATFLSVGPANNEVVFKFTAPSFVDSILTYTGVANGAFVNGHTITQATSGATGVISGSNSTVLSVNNSVGTFLVGLAISDSNGAYANVSVVASNTVTFAIPTQTIGTNTTVNIVGNTAINCGVVISSGMITPLQGITASATANLTIT